MVFSRVLGIALVAAGLLLQGPQALAQQGVARPISAVVPFAPGGNIDFLARQLASRFESESGQKMVVENRPGAGGYSGSAYVARAKPDGQTLLVTIGYVLHANIFTKDLSVDLASTLSPVALLATFPYFLFVSASIPPRTLSELVAYAKRNPNKLNFASVGNSSDMLIHAPRFLKAAGIDVALIPYNGMNDMVKAMLSGDAHLLWTSLGVAEPHLKSGKLFAVATRAAERSETMPGVPTAKEQGVDFAVAGDPPYFAVFGPAGIPPQISNPLNKRVFAALNEPAIRESLMKFGNDVPRAAVPPEELAAAFAREVKEMREGAALFGVKPQ